MVMQMAGQIGPALRRRDKNLAIHTGLRLVYGHEIASYDGSTTTARSARFTTDLAIVENGPGEVWLPRVVVEAKLAKVTTHDAITYSAKAASHRAVHPYLRYGIMLGDRRHFPLPGRLYRHGAHFDFMMSFRRSRPSTTEIGDFVAILRSEVAASRTLERILYESRRPDRDRYTVLHRRLEVK